MEVNDIHSWHNDSRVTDDSDCESEQDLRYTNISKAFRLTSSQFLCCLTQEKSDGRG